VIVRAAAIAPTAPDVEHATPITGARRADLAKRVAERAAKGENDTHIAKALRVKPRQVAVIRAGFAIPAGQPRPSVDRLPRRSSASTAAEAATSSSTG
jgi:hypothetical protein